MHINNKVILNNVRNSGFSSCQVFPPGEHWTHLEVLCLVSALILKVSVLLESQHFHAQNEGVDFHDLFKRLLMNLICIKCF